MPAVVELAPGLHRFAWRHPEWHPPGFEEVAGLAVADDAGTILVDPIADDAGAIAAGLDAVVRGRVRIAVTVPYHVRAAEALAERYDATIHGHPACARRLAGVARFRPAAAGDVLAGGARFHAIGRPQRSELPLWLPSVGALAFGDAVIEVGGALRVWENAPVTGGARERWYRDRYLPTLAALAGLAPRRVLVTHGRSVLEGGDDALRAALAAPPWSRLVPDGAVGSAG